jgi:hypothetical protein
MARHHDRPAKLSRSPFLLLIILIVVAIIFLAGGFSTRGHSTYGTYSTPGMGLGGLLLVIVLVLYLTGNLHL